MSKFVNNGLLSRRKSKIYHIIYQYSTANVQLVVDFALSRGDEVMVQKIRQDG